jgi:hypothetical protein
VQIVLREPWVDFRDRSLSFAELENARAAIKNLVASRHQGFLRLELGLQGHEYVVYLYLSRVLGKLEILGGHRLRSGEPSLELAEGIQALVQALQKEERRHGV